ncbi:MAG: leucine-rich repeat domain-containing protein [Bacteroidales bacterium]|nr:leucine-rich repeat domain-containing protein [Bacteroidales bacterium]
MSRLFFTSAYYPGSRKECPCGVFRLSLAFLLLLLLVSPNAKAYDFMKSIQGVTCFFSFCDNSHVRLDSTSFSGSSSIYHDQWHGRFSLPSTVVNDGERLEVVAVGDSAFAGLDILESVCMPSSLTFIGDKAFIGCNALHSLTLDCDSLGYSPSIFVGCDNLDTLVIGPQCRVIPSMLFSELKSVKYIVLQASGDKLSMQNIFFGNSSNAVLFVDSNVKTIPQRMFYNFTSLQAILFDDKSELRYIERQAFVNCTSLSSISFPRNLERIGEGAFAYCQFTSLSFSTFRPPYVSIEAFIGVDPSLTVFIPCHTRGLYANASVGRAFHNLNYADNCSPEGVITEVVYIHDTVYVHDTLCLPLEICQQLNKPVADSTTLDDDEEEQADDEIDDEELNHREYTMKELGVKLSIDNKILSIEGARSLRGVYIRVFDDRGILVLEQRVPRSQLNDSMHIRLPDSKRYFLRFNMGDPIMIDIPSQSIKKT